jgi:hypothetical protein
METPRDDPVALNLAYFHLFREERFDPKLGNGQQQLDQLLRQSARLMRRRSC